MKKIVLFTLLVSAILTGLAAGNRPAAADAFVNAPSSVFPLLDSLTRLDMIDYILAGRDTKSQNQTGSQSSITAIGSDSLIIQMSDQVTHSIYLLPGKKNDTVIAVVRTVSIPAADSKIELYDMSWKPVKPGYFKQPGIDDWIKVKDKSKKRHIVENIPFVPAKISLSPTGRTLVVYNTLQDLLPVEILQEVNDDIAPAIVYEWNGSTFKPRK